MKRIFMIAVVSGALFSCGGNNESKVATTTATETAPAAATTPAPETGANDDKAIQLIAKSDCLTCHKVHEKLIGPAYADVAKKYPNTEENVKMLVDKVEKGGKGNWGEVPMTPHTSLSNEDATIMVRYILSLK